MSYTEAELLDFVEEHDVKFVRLTFCNLFGVMKNISIMAGELPHALRYGIGVDTSAVEGFLPGESRDILLFPDPGTLSVLPWRPSHGRVVRLFCRMVLSDGTPCLGDSRQLLRRSVKRAGEKGYICQIGCECEFYLFQLGDDGLPTDIPQDRAGYCDVAPLDKGENVRREICLALEEMQIRPESSHHERGPGQNEIVLRYDSALAAADALMQFRSVSAVVAERNGLWASFAPKPLPGRNGSSLHINLSLARGGRNLFTAEEGQHCVEAEHFMAGILRRLPELASFLNVLPQSYQRFGADIPAQLEWSRENREQLVRVPASGGSSHMELRSPDPSLNPYLAFSLLLEAGLEGIQDSLPLARPEDFTAVPLPATLEEAVSLARDSAFVEGVLGRELLAYDCKVKLDQCAAVEG